MFYKIFGSFTSTKLQQVNNLINQIYIQVNFDHLHSVTNKRWSSAHSWAQNIAVIIQLLRKLAWIHKPVCFEGQGHNNYRLIPEYPPAIMISCSVKRSEYMVPLLKKAT
jgi:hypothetical protein